MSPFFKAFLYKDGLTLSQNNIYRNFNIVLGIALLDILVILISLRNLNPVWPVQLCLAEFFCLAILLVVHIRGNMWFARYATFLVILSVQCTACVVHGRTAGFDYVFYALAVLPTLFFRSAKYYLSLFAISITTLLTIQYSYTVLEPLALFPGEYIYYWNIFFTGVVILLVMYIFKSGYERTQRKLIDQHSMIAHQKEEIEVINNNLEQLIVDRTEKIKDQETRINKFAYINAHRVRSPLARIMGLLNLIDLEQNKSNAFEEYLPILRQNTDELNEMLKEVSDTLNDIKEESDQEDFSDT